MNSEEKKYKNLMKQGLSIRTASRILKIASSTLAYRLKKPATQGTLTHGNTGKSNHPFRPDKQKILRIAQEKYPAFGISHLCELLREREGISVPKETLRRWLKRPRKYHPKKKRIRRECSPCFGDLLQIDGSFDVWFGQERTCLMNIVDDAANIARLHFEREETIVSACRCAWSWFQQYGVPRAFYADGHLDPDKEHNFFTMMCEVLGIRVILAHSPQAKGRVERYNGVHQRRLIPLMKLDGVRDMESANKYLERYVVAHNKKFSKPARNGNSHTPLPDWAKDIDDVCFVKVQRKINNDWTVCYKGKIYQIPPMSKRAPAVKKCTVKETLSGHISISYRDRSFPEVLPIHTVQN